MNGRWIRLGSLLVLGLVSLWLLSVFGRGRPDPKIGIALDYQAKQPTLIYGLWMDDRRFVSPWMWVSPRSTKHVALGGSLSLAAKAPTVRAFWRYAAVDENYLDNGISYDQPPWREAQATVLLNDVIDEEALARLRNDPGRHRLSMVLIFDGDRLEVRPEIRQWQ